VCCRTFDVKVDVLTGFVCWMNAAAVARAANRYLGN
jgi:hypothetical protein